jgi:hypothetical protein
MGAISGVTGKVHFLYEAQRRAMNSSHFMAMLGAMRELFSPEKRLLIFVDHCGIHRSLVARELVA